MPCTIGELATALNGIADSLDGLAKEISRCKQDVPIDATPGRSAICSSPVIITGMCKPVVPDTFTVGDLCETVKGLRDWTRDVTTKLANYQSSSPIDAAPWPPSTGS
jgi:hypothetical protein